MSEETARIARMWAAIDPADHRTLDAALAHLRCALSEGLCPFCAESLDAETEEGLSYLVCMNCRTGFPAFTPQASTERLRMTDREKVAEALLKLRERIY